MTLPPEAAPGRAAGAGEGTVALGAAARVDFARLRAERRRRVLDAMAEERIDVLVLGQEPNGRYVSGARRLWTAGTRPFGPGCVVVADGGQVHLLSTWEDGVPPEIPFRACYGLSWDASTVASALAAVDGLARARRIGVDGATPGMARLLRSVAPGAELVDASPMLHRVRGPKTVDELACLRSAVAVAEACLVHAGDGIAAGVSGRGLAGLFAARLGAFGLTVADGPGVFAAASPSEPEPPMQVGGAPLVPGQLVAMAATASIEGYRGDAAWTWPCPEPSERARRPGTPDLPWQPGAGSPACAPEPLLARWHRVRDAMAEACRPGNDARDVLAAYRSTGELPPAGPVVHGIGLGLEPPLSAPGIPGSGGTLEAGMVLVLRAYVWQAGVGGFLGAQVVELTAGGCRPLSRLAR